MQRTKEYLKNRDQLFWLLYNRFNKKDRIVKECVKQIVVNR